MDLCKYDENINNDKISNIIVECEKYRTQLVKKCLPLCDYNIDDSNDCVQDAYLSLIDSLNKGCHINNYKAWMYKVSLNKANKLIKLKIKQKEYCLFNNQYMNGIINELLIYNPDFLEFNITDDMINKKADYIISLLNDEEKNLYELYYIKKIKLIEISKYLNISYSLIRKKHEFLKKKIVYLVKKCEFL
jgi:RNA polymerase sigma factor (sigma-70 family)